MTRDSIIADINRRHDFVLLFDVKDGNPNGDPDAGNLPRVDPETMHGLVTDVCLKRKVRNWMDISKAGEPGFAVYVQNKGIALNALHQQAYDKEGLESTGTKQKRGDVQKARSRMCRDYYDVRAFGAVMTTGVNCGQVRGPLQFTFARSIDPIVPLDLSITRVAITREQDAQVVEGEDQEGGGKVTEMGRKAIVPYGLYRCYGFFNSYLASDTGFNSQDLELFWQALQEMWDMDRSASRGFMSCRGLYIFSHDSPAGKAPANQLLDRVKVRKREGVTSPRDFAHYEVQVDAENLPPGVILTKLVG